MSRTPTAWCRSFFINLLVMVSVVVLLQACGGGGKKAAPASASAPVVSIFAYVANDSSNDVSAYTLNTTTGALTPVNCGGGAGCNGANFAAGTNPSSVTTTRTIQ